jgi:hypothetical protein
VTETAVRYHPTARTLLDDAAKVKPFPENPNNGDADRIAASILKVGCYRPVYCWTQTNEILAGHHLYEALVDRLGQTQVPLAWIDAETLDEARAIVAGDNRIAALALMDDGLLLGMLEQMDPQFVEAAGYSNEDVEAIRTMLSDAAWDDPTADGKAHGEPDEESFLPRIDLRVTSEVFDAWRRFLDAHDGDNDVVKLAKALSAAGCLE